VECFMQVSNLFLQIHVLIKISILHKCFTASVFPIVGHGPISTSCLSQKSFAVTYSDTCTLKCHNHKSLFTPFMGLFF
jgi:hypothetical protein